MKQAVVLCGGKGKRLGALTLETPKPMINVSGKPFLEHLILKLARYGFDEIILCAGYLGGQIFKQFDGRRIYGVKIEVIIEEKQLGTGGAILGIWEKLDDQFMVFNGDTFYDINLSEVMHPASHENLSSVNVIVTRYIQNDGRYGYLELDEDNTVSNFHEKKTTSSLNNVNAGIYIINKKDLLPFKVKKQDTVSLEEQILPVLAGQKRLVAQTYREQYYFVDIGLPETLEYFDNTFHKILKKPALILDRDNTINFDNGYTFDPRDLYLFPDISETIKKVNDAGCYVFVATNQSGIGRGYYSADDVHTFHKSIRKELLSDGAHIDAFEICPHLPSENCACRKPATLMLQRLYNNYQFDVNRSIMIGDKESDVVCGQNFGIRSFKIQNENTLTKIVEKWIADVCK